MPRPRVVTEHLLEFLNAKLGPERFRENVFGAVADYIHTVAPGMAVDDFHNTTHTRGHLSAAFRDHQHIDFPRIANVLRRIGMPVDFLFTTSPALPPWDQWRRGDSFVFLYGARTVPVTRLDRTVCQILNGDRDTQAIGLLTHALGQEFGISARVELLRTMCGMSKAESQQVLAGLLHRADVGCICCVGSPRINGLSDAVAQHVIDTPGPSPVKYTWSEAPPRGPTYLSVARNHGPDDEGIRLKTATADVFLPRVNDAHMIQGALAGNIGPYADAGVLMVDARTRPLVILAAGHGGCGTLAAVYALLDQVNIACQLAASSRPGWFPGQGRLVQMIRASRFKTSRSEVDDAEVSPQRGVGWDVAWPD